MRLVAHLLCLAALIPTGEVLADEADSTRTTRWGVRLQPSGFSGAGFDRRLSERWELGVEVEGNREDGDRDGDTTYRDEESHETQDDDDWSVSIRPEVRRWWTASARWRGFAGARLAYGASSWKRYYVNDRDRSKETGDERSLGCAFTFGVETVLWRSLSLQAAFAPLSFGHSWSDYVDEDLRVDGDGEEYSYTANFEGERSRIAYSARPQLYLVLRW